MFSLTSVNRWRYFRAHQSFLRWNDGFLGLCRALSLVRSNTTPGYNSENLQLEHGEKANTSIFDV
jgi:hypothetical protein